MAQHLDQAVASVSVVPEGDVHGLDRQLEQAVVRVREVAEQLQERQREVLRAQQLAAVGQLAASVAHEVRNPLMAIKMLVDAALRPHNPRPVTAENLAVIRKEVARLEKTVQGFLDFTRPPPLRRGPCDLRAVVADALALVDARAGQQQVRVEWQPPAGPVPADVDASQVKGVLVNLFLNALDAMAGGGRLEVGLRATSQGACLTVADTGAGIPPQMEGRLFTPFASSKATGTGLGLCTSRRVIEEHGGRLRGANRPEGGACFTITLPVPEAAAPPAAAPAGAGHCEESHAGVAGD
jgi:signal transduction histidine kinase